MTAAHQRPALEIVPGPAEIPPAATTATGDDDQWRAAAIIEQYDPEHQLIGSLMWLGIDTAGQLLELVPVTAIWNPQTRWAYELIRRVVDAGDTPTPPAVLAAGRRHPASDALETLIPSPAQVSRLALYLFDAYSQAVAPAATVGTYAREVLDAAYRRAFDTCGRRMQQLSACGADREELSAQFAAIRDELADLWRRAETAAKPARSPR